MANNIYNFFFRFCFFRRILQKYDVQSGQVEQFFLHINWPYLYAKIATANVGAREETDRRHSKPFYMHSTFALGFNNKLEFILRCHGTHADAFAWDEKVRWKEKGERKHKP